MKFGIREITNVMMKAKSAMRLGNKVYYKDEPVLYFDSLKTSSLEGAATTVYAQGGRGNSRLIAWEGERTLTFNMEDALLSPESFAVLSGAGLIENVKKNVVNYNNTINILYEDGDISYTLESQGFIRLTDDFPLFDESVYYSEQDSKIIKKVLLHDQFWEQNRLDDSYLDIAGDSLSLKINRIEDDPNNLDKKLLYGYIYISPGGEVGDMQTFEEAASLLVNSMDNNSYIEVQINIDNSKIMKNITGYEHVVEKVEIKKDENGNYYTKITKDAPYQTSRTVSLINPKNFLKKGVFTTAADYIRAGAKMSLSNPEVYYGDIWAGEAIADYYTPIYNKTVKQLTISSDKFGGNFYLEADTLFRDTYGSDHAATFIIPNCKVQSNFTFTMASSGDPSTFSFVLDAFPGYTRFNPDKKVLACLQINEKGIYEDGLEDRAGTPWVPGAELYN